MPTRSSSQRPVFPSSPSTALRPSVAWHSIHNDTDTRFRSSHVDYCCSLLIRSPRSVTDKLQHVLNAAARVITNTGKYDNGLSNILHHDLQWLDVAEQIWFRVAATVLPVSAQYGSSIPEWAVFSHCRISKSSWQASVCVFWRPGHTTLQAVDLWFPCTQCGQSNLLEFSAGLLKVVGHVFWLL